MKKKATKKPAKKAPKVTAVTPEPTFIGILLDRSGSMERCRSATISGFNEFVNSQRTVGGECRVSLAQFDAPSGGLALDINFLGTPIEKVPALDTASYVPRGCTPLYDAILASGKAFEEWCTTNAWTGKVLCVIITDGYENASREAKPETVREYISAREKAGWSFVYLGANQDAFFAAGNIGINIGATANYSATTSGTVSMRKSLAANTTAYRVSGVRGQAASHSFFSTAGRPELDPDDTTSLTHPVAGKVKTQPSPAGRLVPTP